MTRITRFIPKNIPELFRFGAYLVVLLALGTLNSFAQNDGTQTRTWTAALNFEHDPNLVGKDSLTIFTAPVGIVIERVYWRVDTTTANVDSLQLRTGSSVITLSTYRNATDGGYSEIQIRVPNHPVTRSEALRLLVYGTEGRTGQVRLVIVYRELF